MSTKHSRACEILNERRNAELDKRFETLISDYEASELGDEVLADALYEELVIFEDRLRARLKLPPAPTFPVPTPTPPFAQSNEGPNRTHLG